MLALWLSLLTTYPEIGTLPTARVRGGEGLPQVLGQTSFGSSAAVLGDMLALGAPDSIGVGGSETGSVWVVKLHTNGSVLWYNDIGDGTVSSVAVSADGSTVVSGDGSGKVIV